ncbi:18270_t:CDS:2 [Gigaspora margarita]|uniref:18270_t:CDS:1 n=1 Tax=Gigaspora margarita TaxID=4874 RepID=A0ABN7UZD8_GIGMA|nr:18270_t:CDS:2 [Gigaspora margarita]
MTPTSPLEFSLDNPYINRDKPEDPVNRPSSTNMNTSIDYESVSIDMKIQNLEPNITHTFPQELAFANIFHDMIKIGDINKYEKTVKKYLQVGHHHRIHGNTHYSTPVTSNQH